MGKRWFIRLGVVFIAVMLGAMSGIQYVNELLDISKPTPLEQPVPRAEQDTDKEPESSRLDLTTKQDLSEEQHHNFFSEAAMSGAKGLEELSRGLLNQLVYAIDVGLNGREN